MKKNLGHLLILCAIVFAVYSCKKYDISPPMVTMKGESIVYVPLNSWFEDPGIEALDDEDDAPEVIVTGEVDVTTVGSYTIKYVARDKNNNYANPIYRTVFVIIIPETMYGNWSIWETTGATFNSIITSPWSYYPEPLAKNARFTVDNFANKNIPVNIDLNNIMGTELVIPNYAYKGYNIKGKGVISNKGDKINITYIITNGYLESDTVWTVLKKVQ